MALKSMTGFGEARKTFADWVIQVELSTVNRKQLDIQINLPKPFAASEADLNTWVRGAIARGRVSGFVRIEPAKKERLERQINMSKARTVVQGYRALAKECRSSQPLRLKCSRVIRKFLTQRSHCLAGIVASCVRGSGSDCFKKTA